MPQYQYADVNGQIITEENTRLALTPEEVLYHIRNAFNLFPYQAEVEQLENLPDVFHASILDAEGIDDVYICAKGCTPGGRDALNNEQRIQPRAMYINYVYDKQAEGAKGILLGVYKMNERVVICTWKVTRSNAVQTHSISKQIKIESIAKAIKEGFVQQEKGPGEYACAFRPEFLYFYLRNSDWLHTGIVNELAQHTAPEANADEETDNEVIDTDAEVAGNRDLPRNRIFFGAPGTGKSFTLEKERKELQGENSLDYERVTFHPDYSYANFVGTYKPVPGADREGNEVITYTYVPGPFMRLFVKATRNRQEEEVKPYVLLIEEINRANVAAVFGDVFQLLDRADNNTSEYPIQTSEDMRAFLAHELGGDVGNYSTIRIPDNMYIWATMNSADQGVFPMDTAFKRRWDFTYLGINDSETRIRGKYVRLGANGTQRVEWNSLRKAINSFLSREKINEDKQLGPYFISKKIVEPEDGDEIDRDRFISTFKNKVIMYLFEDAAKQKRPQLFSGCGERSNLYSAICAEFDERGIEIFNRDIQRDANAVEVENRPVEATEGTDENEGTV